jgi:hypothetical protein
MSADMQQAEHQLQQSIRSADRRRRVWIAVAAAAAVLVLAAGIAVAVRLPNDRSTQPPPPPPPPHVQLTVPVTYPLHPAVTVQLPRWVLAADSTSAFPAGQWYGEANGDRGVGLFSVTNMYPVGAPKITQPSYQELVSDWEAVQTRGYGTVTDVVTDANVDGLPATTMTVQVNKDLGGGFVYCQASSDLRNNTDDCQEMFHDRLVYVAIVNQGSTNPPTLLWESRSSSLATPDTTIPTTAAEFAAWLATVRFQ